MQCGKTRSTDREAPKTLWPYESAAMPALSGFRSGWVLRRRACRREAHAAAVFLLTFNYTEREKQPARIEEARGTGSPRRHRRTGREGGGISSLRILDFQNDGQDQRALGCFSRDKALQVGADFGLHDAVVGLFFAR